VARHKSVDARVRLAAHSATVDARRLPAQLVSVNDRGAALFNAPESFLFEDGGERYTHNIFRYPAKFHPPVARKLIEKYASNSSCILDPFCGSGTPLVEALVLGRSAIGFDIDPLATLVSKSKTTTVNLRRLRQSIDTLSASLVSRRYADERRDGPFVDDITDATWCRRIANSGHFIPLIPNIHHWFRKRVIIQLANIRSASAPFSSIRSDALFFDLCFASIIRNASNADPVPVSGLEVTAHMRRKEAAGRAIDPYALYVKMMEKAFAAFSTLPPDTRKRSGAKIRIYNRDATTDRSYKSLPVRPDIIITSPPYLNAVDYYRRHQLEMFWLCLFSSPQERQRSLHYYIGRHNVRVARERLSTPTLDTAMRKLAGKSPKRAWAVSAYADQMNTFFARASELLLPGQDMVIVIGNSQLCETPFPTALLLAELAAPSFDLREVNSYPIQNRYMSYSRKHNGDIKREYVCVYRRRK
jgi:DNA modification methylase